MLQVPLYVFQQQKWNPSGTETNQKSVFFPSLRLRRSNYGEVAHKKRKKQWKGNGEKGVPDNLAGMKLRYAQRRAWKSELDSLMQGLEMKMFSK